MQKGSNRKVTRPSKESRELARSGESAAAEPVLRRGFLIQTAQTAPVRAAGAQPGQALAEAQATESGDLLGGSSRPRRGKTPQRASAGAQSGTSLNPRKSSGAMRGRSSGTVRAQRGRPVDRQHGALLRHFKSPQAASEASSDTESESADSDSWEDDDENSDSQSEATTSAACSPRYGSTHTEAATSGDAEAPTATTTSSAPRAAAEASSATEASLATQASRTTTLTAHKPPTMQAAKRLTDRIALKMKSIQYLDPRVRAHTASWILFSLWSDIRGNVDDKGEGHIPHLKSRVAKCMTSFIDPHQPTRPGTRTESEDEESSGTLSSSSKDTHGPTQEQPQPQPPSPQVPRTGPEVPSHTPHVQQPTQQQPVRESSGAPRGQVLRPGEARRRHAGMGGSWQRTMGKVHLDITFTIPGQARDTSKGVCTSIENWARGDNLSFRDISTHIRQLGKTLRVSVSGTPTGTSWTTVRTCILPGQEWLQTGTVSGRIPGRHTPLTACIIDTTASAHCSRHELQQKLETVCPNEQFRLDPIGRMGHEGATGRGEETSPVWLLSMRKSEEDFITTMTSVLAPALAQDRLRVQTPFKCGRVLLRKGERWVLTHLADIPRLTLSTGRPHHKHEDISKQIVSSLTAAGVPEPAEVWWMATGGRVIARVAFLEKAHLCKAAAQLAKGPLSIGRRTFELAPDLQIMQKSLRERGLCTQCGSDGATGKHGYGRCYATKNRREVTCWHCGERLSNHTGSCPNRRQLIQSTLRLFEAAPDDDAPPNQSSRIPHQEESLPQAAPAAHAQRPEQTWVSPDEQHSRQPGGQMGSTSNVLILTRAAMNLLKAAIALEVQARASQRREDTLAAQQTARALEELTTSLAGMIEVAHS